MKHLFRLLRQDLYRCIYSCKFLFSTMGICLTNFLSVWWDLNATNGCVAYLYMVASHNGEDIDILCDTVREMDCGVLSN